MEYRHDLFYVTVECCFSYYIEMAQISRQARRECGKWLWYNNKTNGNTEWH